MVKLSKKGLENFSFQKKVVMSLLVILMVIFVVGCLDYKAYDIPQEDVEDTEEEQSLLDEIAQIEAELDLQDNEEAQLEGEVILPELDDEEEIDLEEPAEVGDYDYLITVDENELAHLNLKVSDPDKANVTYTFSAPLNEEGKWKTNYGDAGEYLITLTASDGQLETKRLIKLVVNRVNVAPVISKVKDIFAKEGETIFLEPEVNDPNTDPITVTITEPLKTGTFVTDHTSAGEYQIVVLASDGELETKKTIALVIQDVNELPVISNVEDLVIKEGETVTLEPEVTDLDEDQIVLTISDPVGDDGVWKTSFTDNGLYTVTITADDGKDKVTQKVKITVEDVNMPPEITDVFLDN